MQHVACNGFKRKDALKCQTLTKSDDFILKARAPIPGSGHGMSLYINANMDWQLDDVQDMEEGQYCIHEDDCWNCRNFLDTPFTGYNISALQKAENREADSVTVTFAWIYMYIKL